MLRILLTYALPLLLPTILYFLWIQVSAKGEIRPIPWVWLAAAGVVLAGIVLAGLALYGGSPNGTYVPPHVENGRVVPGHIEPKSP